MMVISHTALFKILRLSVTSLGCARGGRMVFNTISFGVESGSAMIIRGKNGAGKSTLLRAIAGLIHPITGTISFDTTDMQPAGHETLCHYIGHKNALKSSLTVLENIDFWQQYYRSSDRNTSALSILHDWGLEKFSKVLSKELSAGQQKRLCLTKLSRFDRPVWLLDEPFNSLDDCARKTLLKLINKHLSLNGIVVIASHLQLPITNMQEFIIDKV